MFISFEEIDRYIKEDVPYIDLTSMCLDIKSSEGMITYFTREDIVVCGTEEVRQIFECFNIKTDIFVSSGQKVSAGGELISGKGQGGDINMAWKVGQNIIEYCSGIATKTQKMVSAVRDTGSNIPVLTTRKIFPGTKPLAIKAVMAGGAVPHRLGLSETVLIFKQHIDFIGGFEALLKKMPELKVSCCEKKIIIETNDFDEADKLCKAGADGIQFDKKTASELADMVAELKKNHRGVIFLAAGGINETNAESYVKANVDGIVTTSLYSANPADIGVKIKPNE